MAVIKHNRDRLCRTTSAHGFRVDLPLDYTKSRIFVVVTEVQKDGSVKTTCTELEEIEEKKG